MFPDAEVQIMTVEGVFRGGINISCRDDSCIVRPCQIRRAAYQKRNMLEKLLYYSAGMLSRSVFNS